MAQENNRVDLSADEAGEWQKKAEEYLNNWKRAAADFINYKKSEVERAGLLAQYAKEDMLWNILPVLDSIYFAEKHGGFEGIDLINKQIADFLKKEGIEEIKTINEKFNPETMDAVEEVDGNEPGMVAEELQKGYLMSGKIIRPARVNVNK